MTFFPFNGISQFRSLQSNAMIKNKRCGDIYSILLTGQFDLPMFRLAYDVILFYAFNGYIMFRYYNTKTTGINDFKFSQNVSK